MSQVKHSYGTQEKYNLLNPPDANTIYFIYDSRRVYRGAQLMASDTVRFGTVVPEFASALAETLYVIADESGVGLYLKGATEMIQVGGGEAAPGSITNITAFNETLLDKATGELTDSDEKIPTSGAVKKAIEGVQTALETQLAEYNGAFVDVAAVRADGNNGTVITFTAKDGSTKDITVSDLFLSAASYDVSTHILSLTVAGVEQPVEVDLGELVPQVVDTATVAMARDITVTVDVGNYKKGDKIEIATTADLQTFLENMLSQDSNPVATQPSASITLSGAGAKEVGSSFTPSVSASLNAGKYTANGKTEASGVTATNYKFTDSNGVIREGAANTATFDAITVEDNTSYKVGVVIDHTEGAVPHTFLGKEYAAAQIAAGSKSANSSAVTGYRNTFYGTLNDKTGAIDSALIRGLSGKSGKALSNGSKIDIAVPAGCTRIVLAYPATLRDVTSITSVEEFGSEIKDSFVLHNPVAVEGFNGYTAANYKVYVKDLGVAQANATTYNVTI